jgi:ABC-2 type transport system ATP-binding protein
MVPGRRCQQGVSRWHRADTGSGVHQFLNADREGRTTLINAIQASGLGKRYGRRWALSDCTLTIPAGRVVGLVGPNGAGKTTLLHLAVGLLTPTSGTISVLGAHPADSAAQLGRVGFVAQDTPVYPGMSVAEHLRMGQALNPGWDSALARRRIEQLGLDPRQRAGRLSGGQRAQLALTLAVAKRPDLLILDEPVASLDPLARREFLEAVTQNAVARGMTVVLSSHLMADLERICDYLVLLVASRVRLAGMVGDLLTASPHGQVSLDDLVIAHMSEASGPEGRR